MAHSYYQAFSSEPTDAASFPFQGPQNAQSTDDTLITEEELFVALQQTKENRSPGTDGLPAAFYKKLCPLLKRPLANLCNRLIEWGELTPSMNERLIALVSKDRSKASDLEAWRPITLLHSDYKLLAKCLSMRLTPPRPSILGPQQACCIPGRSVELHAIALRDLLT